MFPYADRRAAYWTGLYTSRPNFKKMIKDLASQFYASSYLFEIRKIQLPDEIFNNRVNNTLFS